MSICNGCGGVVGRDCFNPQECEWISRDMQQRSQYSVDQMIGEIQALWNEVTQLRARVDALTTTPESN